MKVASCRFSFTYFLSHSVVACVGLAMGLMNGCASEPVAPSAMAPTAVPSAQKTAPSSDVSRLQAWRDAELIASMGEGRMEVIGSGESMQPVYGENTILVISKIPFDDLKSGMTIAYMSQKGHQVVHQLVAKEAAGWRVQGVNNEVEDHERVTRDNLIGVVYASLAYNPAL